MVEVKDAMDKSNFYDKSNSTDAVRIHNSTRGTGKFDNISELSTTISNEGRFI